MHGLRNQYVVVLVTCSKWNFFKHVLFRHVLKNRIQWFNSKPCWQNILAWLHISCKTLHGLGVNLLLLLLICLVLKNSKDTYFVDDLILFTPAVIRIISIEKFLHMLFFEGE